MHKRTCRGCCALTSYTAQDMVGTKTPVTLKARVRDDLRAAVLHHLTLLRECAPPLPCMACLRLCVDCVTAHSCCVPKPGSGLTAEVV